MSLKKKLVFIFNHSRLVISTPNLSTQKMEVGRQLRTCADLKQIWTTNRVPVFPSPAPQETIECIKNRFSQQQQ